MSIFKTEQPAFAGFLRNIAASNSGNNVPNIEARNFLLDPGVMKERAASYSEPSLERGFGHPGEWLAHHNDYLTAKIYLQRPKMGRVPSRLNPQNPATCPETFRFDGNFTEFGDVDKGLHLLRVLELGTMLKLLRQVLRSAVSEQQVVEAATEVSRHWPDPSQGDAEALALFDGILQAWTGVADLRPAYASFLAEHEKLLGDSPEKAEEGWADRLRDRLGLAHIDPASRGGPIRILVFRYPLARVPTRVSLKGRRPLATPTVLDSQWSRAFCPAPRGLACGRTVDLTAELHEPASEVVHPHFDLESRDLFRVGTVTKAVAGDLWEARWAHLRWLREKTGNPRFALDTDPEEARS